jgi:hypothetical protein
MPILAGGGLEPGPCVKGGSKLEKIVWTTGDLLGKLGVSTCLTALALGVSRRAEASRRTFLSQGALSG